MSRGTGNNGLETVAAAATAATTATPTPNSQPKTPEEEMANIKFFLLEFSTRILALCA
jgi:hypothetical protein